MTNHRRPSFKTDKETLEMVAKTVNVDSLAQAEHDSFYAEAYGELLGRAIKMLYLGTVRGEVKYGNNVNNPRGARIGNVFLYRDRIGWSGDFPIHDAMIKYSDGNAKETLVAALDLQDEKWRCVFPEWDSLPEELKSDTGYILSCLGLKHDGKG